LHTMCFHWGRKFTRMETSKEWSHMTFMSWCKTYCLCACNIWCSKVVGWRSSAWTVCLKICATKLWT
jgi:hypothetical protein